jgi:hypothetical protein
MGMVANDVAPRGCDNATYGCKADDLPLSLIRSFHHPCSFASRNPTAASAAVHQDSQISRPQRDVHCTTARNMAKMVKTKTQKVYHCGPLRLSCQN